MAAQPVFDAFPPAPNRGDAPADFSAKADTFVAALPPFALKMNVAITWMAATMTAVQGLADAASASATAAADSATLAGQKVGLAADQVALAAHQVGLAEDQADNASLSAAQAQIYAQAAQAGTVPAPIPNRFLGTDSAGLVGWRPVVIPPAFYTGDILDSSRALATPDWLACDGAIYLQASYPALFAKIGQASKPFDPMIPISKPAVGTTTNCPCTAFSPDGAYFATAGQSAFMYKRSADTFTQIALPADATGECTAVAFSPDGLHFSAAYASTPYVRTYRRVGDVFTRISNFSASIPTGPTAIAYSPNGVHFAVSHPVAPFVTIYERSADFYGKLPDPADYPPGAGNGISFSNTGSYLTVTSGVSPFFITYKISGNAFTKLADPAVMPAGTAYSPAFSPDGNYLAVGSNAAPFLLVYKRAGDVFSKLPDLTTPVTTQIRAIAFTPDNNWLLVGGPSLGSATYKRVGDTLTKMPYATAAGLNHIAVSANSRIVAMGLNSDPWVSLYKDAPYDTLTEFAVPTLVQPGTFANIKRFIKT